MAAERGKRERGKKRVKGDIERSEGREGGREGWMEGGREGWMEGGKEEESEGIKRWESRGKRAGTLKSADIFVNGASPKKASHIDEKAPV